MQRRAVPVGPRSWNALGDHSTTLGPARLLSRMRTSSLYMNHAAKVCLPTFQCVAFFNSLDLIKAVKESRDLKVKASHSLFLILIQLVEELNLGGNMRCDGFKTTLLSPSHLMSGKSQSSNPWK